MLSTDGVRQEPLMGLQLGEEYTEGQPRIEDISRDLESQLGSSESRERYGMDGSLGR